MHVLLTGSAGYVGRHVARELSCHGVSHTPFDLAHGDDVCDRASLARAFASQHFDAVIHLAAVPSVPACEADWHRAWRTNHIGTRCLIEAMRRGGCRRLVFASSSAVYGDSENAACGADRGTQKQVSVYGRTKDAAEVAIEYPSRVDIGFSAVVLRLFNVAGNLDTTTGRLIPALCRAARGATPFTLHASPDCPGGATRDYVHVEDAARAFRLALSYDRSPLLVADVGSGAGYTVRQVVRRVAQASGRPVVIHEAPWRPGDARCAVADTRRAGAALNWRATRTLEEIVRSAWEAERGGERQEEEAPLPRS